MENIIENNKLIAEFMGYEFITNNIFINRLPKDFLNNSESYKCFHNSWDWLIPVVKKCLIGEAETNRPDLVLYIYESLVDLEINLVYKDIIEFIKWYNQQNKS